jgi:hypothetical protein
MCWEKCRWQSQQEKKESKRHEKKKRVEREKKVRNMCAALGVGVCRGLTVATGVG